MSDDRLFWIVMGILGVGLIFLVLNDSAGQIGGVSNYDVASFVKLAALAAVFGAAIVARRAPVGHSLRQMAIWLIIILAIMVGYQLAEQRGWLPNDRRAPEGSGTGITASLMHGVDRSLHL